MKLNKGILLFLMAFLPILALAQTGEVELAEQYYNDGEFQNALNLYSKLQKKDPTVRLFNQRIASCYGQLEQYEEGVDFLTKAIRKNASDHILPFMKADLMRLNGDADGANALENKVIVNDLKSEAEFLEAGGYQYKRGRQKLALATYLQARKTLRDKYAFASEIANLYGQAGEYTLATEEYLIMLEKRLDRVERIKLNVLNLVTDDSKEVIETALLAEVQKNSKDRELRNLIYEFYVLTENFYEAFIQVKSIDRLNSNQGALVFNFAMTLRNNKEYRLSNKALDYIIEEYSKGSYGDKAYQEKTVNTELVAFETLPLDTNLIREAVNSYEDLLTKRGRYPQYFNAMYRKANLQAFYLFDLPGATQELQQMLNLGIPPQSTAKANLLYGDVLLMQKEYNKSKLRYNMVAEAFKEGQIGAGAKFKQGRLSYFKGDFEYSKARLKTIKDNTSNDISNDAIQLFLLIQDNVGLDTTTVALERFAQAQLMVFQRDFDPSLELLDSILYAFPNHTLTDDILWEKANIYEQKNNVEKTLSYLDKVINEFPTDIHGDDALYKKAQIYDHTLNDKEEAMKLYIEFLRNYTGSLFIVAVRKRIRELRNEKI
jgi:tetratricopeptide (TPR) repeat protein